MSIPTLTLKKDRERSVLHRHPWIFSGGIERVDLQGHGRSSQGQIVQVRSATGTTLAAGFYDADSQIRCRLFHFGDWPAEGFDDAFWRARLEQAHGLRRDLLPPQTTGFRLIHSESDGLPGLICDVYDRTAVVQIQHPGARHLIEMLVDYLRDVLAVEHIRLDTGEWLHGHNPSVEFKERGMRFRADVVEGQKTGFYLDQRDNRRLVEERSAGRHVLNVFSYTGGFSVAALRGGAARVDSVDLSVPALALAETNVALNGGAELHRTIKADCFEHLRQIDGDTFDLIVLDPPAFAKNRASVDRAARGYKDINLQAMKKIRRGGLLFSFSCSQHVSTDLFRKILFGAAADSGRDVKILDYLTQAADHPINIYHPEGEYLKGLLLRVD